MNRPNALYRAAQEVQEYLSEEGWRNCLIGGVAVLRWGNPRQTTDFDLCLLAGWEGTDAAIDCLCSRYDLRVADGIAFARRTRVLLLRSEVEAVTFDVSIGALPFEESMVDRSSDFEFAPGLVLRTCSAEDLVVMKCLAGRAIDVVDVRGVLARQGRRLEVDYVRTWLSEIQEAIEGRDLVGDFDQLVRDALH